MDYPDVRTATFHGRRADRWRHLAYRLRSFDGATVLLTHRWILVDVHKASDRAVAQHQVVLKGSPPHIRQVAGTFPGRWLAVLYIELHPELIDDGT